MFYYSRPPLNPLLSIVDAMIRRCMNCKLFYLKYFIAKLKTA